ncbi:MAG: hypothetical protein Q8M94_01780 [Ignavibacteria bacterium]|nr:hypothetical protein [Ignavibacteria bacterium]
MQKFTSPGDISASKRYYKEDIAEPEFLVHKDGTMDVPTKPGTCLTAGRLVLK